MNHIFCFNCGEKLLYNLSKPNFCTSCGDSVNGTSPAKRSTPQKSQASSDDFTDSSEVPRLTRLDVETEQFGGSFTLGSLAGKDTKPKFNGRSQYKFDEFTK